jgi:hypothetical protein
MDGIEEVFDNGSLQGGVVTSGAATISEKMWYQARLACYQSLADKQILEERLKAKDAQYAILEERLKVKDVEQTMGNERSDKEKALRECEHLKESAAKDAEKEMEKAEKEKALRECEYVKESAAKDVERALLQCEHLKEMAAYETRMKELELSNLRMQLELAKTRNSGEGGSTSGGKPNRKRAQASDDEEDEEENTGSNLGAAKLPTSGGSAQIYWLVAYEGDEELSSARLQPKLPLLTSIHSARFGDRWFSLLIVSKRIRSTPIMRAVRGIAGRVWVEAFHGCKTSVGVDVPEGSAQTPAGVRILAYIEKKGEGLKFPMVVVR